MENPIHSPFGPLVTAMVTPFDTTGAVDFGRAAELTAYLLDHGSSGLVVSGTTGEAPTLSPDDKLELFRTVKKAAGRVPVIANTGGNDTASSVEFTKKAAQTGVDGILMVVPYYNKPSQEGLFQHFQAIGGATDLPCLLYNVPGRTSRNMDAATQARLSEIPNIIGTKEASGDLMQIAKIRAATPENWAIYSGADEVTLPMLPLGCCGCISVVSHIAGPQYRAMMEAFWAGEITKARDLHLRLLPVIEAIFPVSSPSPAPVKAALALQGFESGGLRLPLLAVDENERASLKKVLETADLL